MTLQELIQRFRVLSGDRQEPFFWLDEEIAGWLSDAQEQACVRGRLLREDADPAVCEIALTPGQHTYPLHEAVYELIDVRYVPAAGRKRPLFRVTREWLDNERPDWRDDEHEPQYVIQDELSIRVVGKIEAGDMIRIECYRLPMQALEDDADEPEIHRAHHIHLIQWALKVAFSVVDAETLDPERSEKAEEEFTRYFGPLPDADLRRETRWDVPHHNEAVMP